jgi:hypothetical protein
MLFKVELNLVSPVVHLTFYSSRLGSYTMTQARQVALGWLDPYIVGHYRLEVENNVFNGVGTSSLIVLPCRTRQQRGSVLSGRLAL